MFEQKTSLHFYPTQLLINYMDYKGIVIDDQKYWRLWENVNSKYKRILQLICNSPNHSEYWTMSEKIAVMESVVINLYSILDIMKKLVGMTYFYSVDRKAKENIEKKYKKKYKDDPVDYRELVKNVFLKSNKGFLSKLYLNNFMDIRNGIVHGGLGFIASDKKFYIDILDFKTDSMIVFSDIYCRCDQPYHLLIDGFEFSKYYLNLIRYYCFDLVKSFIIEIEGHDFDNFDTILNPNVGKGIKDLEYFLDSIGSIINISFSIENYEKDLIKVKGFKKRLFDEEKNNLKEIHKIDDDLSRGTDLVENYQEIMLRSFLERNGIYEKPKKIPEGILIELNKEKLEYIFSVEFEFFCHEFSLNFEAYVEENTDNYILLFRKSYFLNCWMDKRLNFGRLSKRYK